MRTTKKRLCVHQDNLPDDYSLCRRYIIQAITMLVTVHGTQSFQKMMIKSVDESILQFVETTAGTALILILINFKIDAVGSGSMRIVWDKFGLYIY